MKPTTEPTLHHGTNAWGADSKSMRQRFEIEPGDVGAPRPNYLGHGHSAYKLTTADVGRVIEHMWLAPGDTWPPHWNCWTFVTDAGRPVSLSLDEQRERE